MKSPWVLLFVCFGGCWPDCKTDPTLEPTECIAQWTAKGEEYVARDPADECGDDFEPNEDISEAATVPSRPCENENATWSGHLRDETDVDVFRTGACSSGLAGSIAGSIIPITTSLETKNDYLRICVFPMCHDGATNLQACSDGTTRVDHTTTDPPDRLWSTRLDSGFTGCCRVGPGRLDIEFACQFISREVDTFFWVDMTPEAEASCSSSAYEITYTVD